MLDCKQSNCYHVYLITLQKYDEVIMAFTQIL